MKIAILYFQDTKKPLAGDSVCLSNLSQSLVQRGHKVEILSLFGPQSRSSLWKARFKRSIYSAYIFAKATKLSRYDIVLFTEPLYPFNMLLLRYLKFITKAHIVLNEVGTPRVKNKFYYLPIRNKFPVLINGENARPFAENIATKVELLPPCVDTTKLRPLEIDKKWDLLYVGHLYREKGVFLLLQAMNRLKERGFSPKLKIICTPCVEEKFHQRYIRENSLANVDMETAIISDHISVYNSARVFVYPGISYNRVAQVPLTILEASACGLPVVCTTLYRHIELPNISFAEPTPESLADAIIRATKSCNSSKGERTIAVVRERYSVNTVGEIAESIFARVIENSRR